ncbi:hypothetical protein E2C01_012720 [Portunus trituberculatus]|uniref:Uncharacterized protein n=1 Tax=Portunus trituberculatus TaxID=210409 RepID=A0A5B7DEF8_PORTR|nr:hypothetical protein [Portunus trituberculatus]
MDHEWHLMSDPFSDVRPEPVPVLSASADMSVPPFMCPHEAFTYTFDKELGVDSLCKLMNKRAQTYIYTTGKKKVNVPAGILEQQIWEALFNFRPIVAQAILFIVVPISPTKCIFGVTTWNLDIMVTCR